MIRKQMERPQLGLHTSSEEATIGGGTMGARNVSSHSSPTPIFHVFQRGEREKREKHR